MNKEIILFNFLAILQQAFLCFLSGGPVPHKTTASFETQIIPQTAFLNWGSASALSSRENYLII